MWVIAVGDSLIWNDSGTCFLVFRVFFFWLKSKLFQVGFLTSWSSCQILDLPCVYGHWEQSHFQMTLGEWEVCSICCRGAQISDYGVMVWIRRWLLEHQEPFWAHTSAFVCGFHFSVWRDCKAKPCRRHTDHGGRALMNGLVLFPAERVPFWEGDFFFPYTCMLSPSFYFFHEKHQEVIAW